MKTHLSRFLILGFTLSILSVGAQAETYVIDKAHSEVTFKVRHLGISNVAGRFNDFEGSIEYNPDAIHESAVSATIEIASLDTANTKRDNHVISADYLDAEKYPHMIYVSSKVEKGEEEGVLIIHGTLTLHGVSKSVDLELEIGGVAKDNRGRERAGFTATTKINRKDFGMSLGGMLDAGDLMVSDEVRITLEIEAKKKE